VVGVPCRDKNVFGGKKPFEDLPNWGVDKRQLDAEADENTNDEDRHKELEKSYISN
jgi:hypothetical protein